MTHRTIAQSRLDVDLESDPLSLLANFFDCSVVFALSFMVALLVSPGSRSAGESRLEELTRTRKELKRYRPTRESAQGEGRRLGIAYRLANGEVVYVPDGEGE